MGTLDESSHFCGWSLEAFWCTPTVSRRSGRRRGRKRMVSQLYTPACISMNQKSDLSQVLAYHSGRKHTACYERWQFMRLIYLLYAYAEPPPPQPRNESLPRGGGEDTLTYANTPSMQENGTTPLVSRQPPLTPRTQKGAQTHMQTGQSRPKHLETWATRRCRKSYAPHTSHAK